MNRYANCTSESDLVPLGLTPRSLTCRRMLEDPTYASIVRWGDEGDSFVVLEVGSPSQPSHRAALTLKTV